MENMDMDQEKENLPLFGGDSAAPEPPEVSEPPPAAPEPAAEPEPPRLRIRVSDVEEPLSFGEYLRRLRQENALSMEQIANETKIGVCYLEALENEDFSQLPPTAYVLGYVRKLCALYGVAADRADEITSGLREQLEYELPEDIAKSVIDHEISEENERKLRQLVVLFSAAGILAAAVLVAGGIFLLAALHRSSNAATAFNEALLLENSPEVELKMSELKP